MEKLVVIMDVMPEYATRLALYLNSSREFPYRAVVVKGAEEAKNYRDRDAIYAILAAEELEQEVLELAAGTNIRLLWLGETKGASRRTLLFRYGSAKEIEKQFILKEIEKKGSIILGFFSPAGGCEAELLSRKIAVELGKRSRILYLPFFPFGIYGREGKDGLSEAIFYLRQQKESLEGPLSGLLQRGEFMDGLGPLRWYTEIESITKEDIKALFRPENWDEEYQVILLAVGSFDRAGRDLLSLCDGILMPVWEHEEGRRLQEEFRRQLKESGEIKIYSGLLEFPVTDPLSATLEEAVQSAVRKGGAGIEECPGGDS